MYCYCGLIIESKSVDRAGRGDWVSGRAREVPSERHHGGGDVGGRGSGGQRPGQGRVSYSCEAGMLTKYNGWCISASYVYMRQINGDILKTYDGRWCFVLHEFQRNLSSEWVHYKGIWYDYMYSKCTTAEGPEDFALSFFHVKFIAWHDWSCSRYKLNFDYITCSKTVRKKYSKTYLYWSCFGKGETS